MDSSGRFVQRLQPGTGQFSQQNLDGLFPFHGNGGVPTMLSPVGIHMQIPRFAYDSVPALPPLDQAERLYSNGTPSPVNCSSIKPPSKKRGRPRKDPRADGVDLSISSASANRVSVNAGCMDSSVNHGTQTAAKRGRGRPPGPAKRQLDALGPCGVNFATHVITVDKDQDIVSKICNLSEPGPRAIFIISAFGSVSNVTIRIPEKSDGNDTITFQGQYNIMWLSVCPFPSKNGDSSLNVSFNDSEGVLLGGPVVGTLIAATSVQITLGSFSIDGIKSNTGLPSPPPPVADYSPSPIVSSELPLENINLGSIPSSFLDSSETIQMFS